MVSDERENVLGEGDRVGRTVSEKEFAGDS